MSWTTNTQYYITPSRKGALYTLRKAWSASCPNVGHRNGDEFVANLYTADAKDALKRARIGHSVNTNIEIRGKATGDLSDTPADYLAWAVINCAEKFTEKQLVFIYDNRTDVMVLLDEATKQREENIRRRDERIAKQAEWEAARHSSEYVSTIDTRQVFEATVIHASTFTTKYGDTRFILMKTEEGDILKSLGSAAALWEMKKDETYMFTGTVVAHEEYQGQKGTKIARIKLS